MTREQARKYINSRISIELTKAKKRVGDYDTYICPFCGNGSGEDGDGICTENGKNYKCFVCDFYGDYLDILEKLNGTGETGIFKLYGLKIFGDSPTRPSAMPSLNPQQEKPRTDYVDFFLQANTILHESPEALVYLQSRGISTATADRFKLGYAPEWKHPNTLHMPNISVTTRIITPTSKFSYLARAIDPKNQYPKQKVGATCLFNVKALQSKEHPFIFITEGEFDALSVMEVGGQAIALGGTGIRQLEKILKENSPPFTLVLALDNDKAGQNVQAVLKKRLQALKISVIEANIPQEYKDLNEFLQNDRDSFKLLVQDPAKRDEKKTAHVKSNSVNGSVDKFIQTINDTAAMKAVPTGFNTLDKALDGGLYEGLYIIGAVSSIGKTTFCLQIADQIAQQGEDVIIFSLEMSKNILISKSLSRLTLIEDNRYALTSRQIISGMKKGFSQKAMQTYDTYNQNLYIYEATGNIGAEEIKKTVKKHIAVMEKKPVVIIDYLQILNPGDNKSSDKQNIDKAVLELKRLSMEHKIPVLAVSSFNRDNYLNPVNMSSFKESGAIEYSSDVLLGLQFKGMDGLYQSYGKNANLQQIEEWQRADPRVLELKVLKNRQGASGNNIYFEYRPRFNHFMETINPKIARIKQDSDV